MADGPFWMSLTSLLLSGGSLVVSGGSLPVSLRSLAASRTANREAQTAARLEHRLEGMNHVRWVMHDVILDGNITADTVASIREAVQISDRVFSAHVAETLNQLRATIVHLHHTPSERLTERDLKAADELKEKLEAVLERMKEEAGFGKPTAPTARPGDGAGSKIIRW